MTESVGAFRSARAVASLLSAATPRALDAKYGVPRTNGADYRAGDGAEADQPGSNALALAGSRTTTGSPILLCNPHLSWASLYWEAQVTVPGKIDFFGNTLAGYPVLWAGFNEVLGWANTVNAVDLEDLYALPIDPASADRYLFEGVSRPLTARTVTIEVRGGGGSPVGETRTFW